MIITDYVSNVYRTNVVQHQGSGLITAFVSKYQEAMIYGSILKTDKQRKRTLVFDQEGALFKVKVLIKAVLEISSQN